MSVELRPLAVQCNIRCQYCYQNPQRDAEAGARPYDLAAMKAAIEEEGGPFALFGGEPLLIPEADLEELWSWGLARFGRNSVQTNGSLINDRHIALFRRYRVHVGLSIDGPGELNDVRWAGTLSRTREATARTEAAIARLCREGIPPSLIVTLHRGNASGDRLPLLRGWLTALAAQGVRRVRLHLLEVENEDIRGKYALTAAENLAALRGLTALADEGPEPRLAIDIHDEMARMLRGADGSTGCVWRACDPYTTAAVRGVEGQGQRSNCGRTNKDGIDFVKADRPGYERYLALYETPQEVGGCQGCRFFLMCKGQCPGTALHGDWRNRTEHCEIWQALYAGIEAQQVARGEQPLSLAPHLRQVEEVLLEEWSRGDNPPVEQVVQEVLAGKAARPGEGAPRLRWRRPRHCWVSDQARAVWLPRMERIRRCLSAIEWQAVAAGIRACAVQRVEPPQIGGRDEELARHGLTLLMLDTRQELGAVLEHQVVMGTAEAVRACRDAWQSGDVDAVGRMLGYPGCCIGAFRRVCVEGGVLDPTWHMAGGQDPGGRSVEVQGVQKGNVLLRWLGVAAVPHLPCGLRCPESIALADQLVGLGRALGHGEEMDWLLEVLSWPVSWSALHGIVEIKAPVLKLTLAADWTPDRREVRLLGSRYPDEGAQGLVFPYRRPAQLKVTGSRGYERGLEHPLRDAAGLWRGPRKESP